MALPEFGRTLWGRKFLKSFHQLDAEHRLSKGKSYVRNNRIANLEVEKIT